MPPDAPSSIRDTFGSHRYDTTQRNNSRSATKTSARCIYGRPGETSSCTHLSSVRGSTTKAGNKIRLDRCKSNNGDLHVRCSWSSGQTNDRLSGDHPVQPHRDGQSQSDRCENQVTSLHYDYAAQTDRIYRSCQAARSARLGTGVSSDFTPMLTDARPTNDQQGDVCFLRPAGRLSSKPHPVTQGRYLAKSHTDYVTYATPGRMLTPSVARHGNTVDPHFATMAGRTR